ncbi:MAG: hypothetical protein FJ149_05795 [Euryarchaeota archaeon]|nr:hypothetical protein [Euryarchaeota archaeon]
MAGKGRSSTALVAFVLVAGPLLSLLAGLPAPVSGAPEPAAGSWTDSFEPPDELAGVSLVDNATVEQGSIVPAWSLRTGTGADGNLEVTGTAYTDTVRTHLVANVQAFGQDHLSVNNSLGFSEGDEVLIVQMVGTSAGTWEYARVAGTAVSRITLTAQVAHSYMGTSTNRAQVVRVPNFRAVNVYSNGVLTCTAWDGTTGGVLCFRATGDVAVRPGGTIDVSGKGFAGGGATAGGPGGAGGSGGTGGGQAQAGDAGGTTSGGGSGGAGGSGSFGRPGGPGGPGGGAGAAGLKGSAGKPGQSSSGAGAGSGQGGSNKGSADLANLQIGGGGGGGQGGNGGAGAGGGGGGGGGRNPGQDGTPGGHGGPGGTGSEGGAGGGAVIVTARAVEVEGSIRANGLQGSGGLPGGPGESGGRGGQGGPGGGSFPYYYDGGGGGGGNGASGGQGGFGGGGGSGGTIWLSAFDVVLGQGLVTALGGPGGNGAGGGAGGAGGEGGPRGGNSAQPGSPGGAGPSGAAGVSGSAGGPGRIRLDSLTSSGAVSPAGTAVLLARQPYAAVASVAVTPASLAGWSSFNVDYTLVGRAVLIFDLLDASNGSSLGEWIATGDGRESLDISELANLSLVMRARLYSDGPESPALHSWDLTWSPNRPPAPPADLSVDGAAEGSPGAMNITVLVPSLGWAFADNGTGQQQGAYNASVWTGPNGTGALMWSLERTGKDDSVLFGSGAPSTPLVKGSDYYFRVRVRDSPLAGSLWSPHSEMRFHINAPPVAPGLRSPADASTGVKRPVQLSWNASADPEGAPLTYEWQVSGSADFAALRGSGTTNVTNASLDLSPNTPFHWRVRSFDGLESSGWSEVWTFSVSSNRPPSVASPPRTSLFFYETRELNLTAFGSDAEDGTNLSWDAGLTGGPGVGGDPAPLRVEVEGRTLRLVAGTVEGTFNVTLRATDSEGFTGSAVMFVTVSYAPPNQAPRISLNGSTIAGGSTLRIDLLKHVSDEEPLTIRWTVLSNNTLLNATIEGNTLVLQAGKPRADAQVQLRLHVTDRYNLTDQAFVVFTVKAPKPAATGGFPWSLAIAAVVVVVLVLALAGLVLARRGVRRAPAAEPEDEVVQMDEEPAPAGSWPPGPPAGPTDRWAPGPPAAPAQQRPPGPPAPRARYPPQAPAGQPHRPPAPRPPRPPAVPPPEPAREDLPVLEGVEPVRPESRVQAPSPAKGARDLDEILALLNKKR